MGDAGSTLIGFTVICLLERRRENFLPEQPGYRAMDYRYSIDGYGGDYVSPSA